MSGKGKDNFQINTIDHLISKISSDIQIFHNKMPERISTAHYNTLCKLYDTCLKAISKKMDTENSEEYKELLRQYQELRRVK